MSLLLLEDSVTPPTPLFGTYDSDLVNTLMTWAWGAEQVFTFPWAAETQDEAFLLDQFVSVLQLTKT